MRNTPKSKGTNLRRDPAIMSTCATAVADRDGALVSACVPAGHPGPRTRIPELWLASLGEGGSSSIVSLQDRTRLPARPGIDGGKHDHHRLLLGMSAFCGQNSTPHPHYALCHGLVIKYL
jgi:hypothetical protein